mmetsp:Transcript_27682/g.51123  ORF Transcript_27682/g.51123 Transcript_27682/m.51123 type:complete len:481 (-) Transcript_27682:228-1670(-)
MSSALRRGLFSLRNGLGAKVAESCFQSGKSSGSSCANVLIPARQRLGASLFVSRRLQSTVAEAASTAAKAATNAASTGVYAELFSSNMTRGTRLAMATWVGLSGAWVYSMVVLGGVTRLTRSGLSMTEWKLTGEKAPSTKEEWEAEFEKYKTSPEFRKVHSRMSLDEFKFIYYMEYTHRMWGRLLGLVFALPCAAFAIRGNINAPLAKRLGLGFFMGGVQGLVGWWMVRSGLKEPVDEYGVPRVSPYRLAAHLVSAFGIFTTLTWTTLDLVYPSTPVAALGEAGIKAASQARRLLLPLAVLVGITATSGAFVAGLDAGRAYNTWPLMDGGLVPEQYFRLSGLRNFFENTAAVQFNHRTLATATLVAFGLVAHRMAKLPIPARARTCFRIAAGLTVVQFSLGVAALLMYVPTSLGSLHQANALNLFTAVLATLHALRAPGTKGCKFVAPLAAAATAGVGYIVVNQNGTMTQSPSYTGPSSA